MCLALNHSFCDCRTAFGCKKLTNGVQIVKFILQTGQKADLSGLMEAIHKRTASPFPDMLTAIKLLKQSGLKTALLTNNWFISEEQRGVSMIPFSDQYLDTVSNANLYSEEVFTHQTILSTASQWNCRTSSFDETSTNG